MPELRFLDPAFLLLAAALPLLWWLQGRQRRDAALRFPTLAVVQPSANRRGPAARKLLLVLRCLVLLLLAVALARPQRGRAESEARGEGIDILLAVDISGSMLAEDFTLPDGQRGNRLDALKGVVREFVQARPNDRFGLVLFGARPYTQCPLTLDHGWLLQNLDRAEIGMIEDGTAIGSALAAAAARLRGTTAKSKVVILLTDGQNNAGKVSPLTAADAVRALGIRTYTIGAGTRGMAPFPARDLFGNKVYQPVPVDIDEDTLREIASRTGGSYFRATDTASLQQVYAEIDRLERSEFSAPRYLDYDEFFPWLIGAALLLLATEFTLAETRLRILP